MEDTFGIEEEFMLLDRHTLAPVPVAEAAIDALIAASDEGAVTSEFLPSQVEYATEVCRTPQEAWQGISTFRGLLGQWADAHGFVVAPSGTPFQRMPNRPELPSDRYRKIARDVGRLTTEHLVNGMHVHVGISDAEEGVRILGGLRGWLPLLLALSANSPFWAGEDTTHHSWRSIQTRRWTTYGIPPRLRDAAEYEALRTRLTGIGATQEYSTTSWAVRLSENFPTVEVRVCDTQLTPRAALAMALIIRALARACADPGDRILPLRSHVLDAELWHAARYGLTKGICDPLTDEHRRASEVVERLRRVIAPHLAAQETARIVESHLEEIAAGRTGAALQRQAFLGGRQGLAALYRQSLDEADPGMDTGPHPQARPVVLAPPAAPTRVSG